MASGRQAMFVSGSQYVMLLDDWCVDNSAVVEVASASSEDNVTTAEAPLGVQGLLSASSGHDNVDGAVNPVALASPGLSRLHIVPPSRREPRTQWAYEIGRVRTHARARLVWVGVVLGVHIC